MFLANASAEPKRSNHINKEELEKGRLARRSRHNYNPEKDDPFLVEKNTSLHVTEHDRFRTGGATLAMKEERDRQRVKKSQQISNWRRRNLDRTNGLKEKREKKAQNELKRMQLFREAGMKALKNQSSVPYDTLNHRFKDNLDGKRLAHREDKCRYRAKMRQNNLYQKQNGKFNPITGKINRETVVPQRPATPPNLKHLPIWQRR
ncbi:hypothetical protein AAMO2058_001166600 [Amorphochlora amoebiformis]